MAGALRLEITADGLGLSDAQAPDQDRGDDHDRAALRCPGIAGCMCHTCSAADAAPPSDPIDRRPAASV